MPTSTKRSNIGHRPLEYAQVYRDLLRKRFNRRRKRARLQGKELHTTLEIQAAFQSLNNQLRLVRKTFNRIQRLDLMEDMMMNTKDKMAGRNRLRLGWGKE